MLASILQPSKGSYLAWGQLCICLSQRAACRALAWSCRGPRALAYAYLSSRTSSNYLSTVFRCNSSRLTHDKYLNGHTSHVWAHTSTSAASSLQAQLHANRQTNSKQSVGWSPPLYKGYEKGYFAIFSTSYTNRCANLNRAPGANKVYKPASWGIFHQSSSENHKLTSTFNSIYKPKTKLQIYQRWHQNSSSASSWPLS